MPYDLASALAPSRTGPYKPVIDPNRPTSKRYGNPRKSDGTGGTSFDIYGNPDTSVGGGGGYKDLLKGLRRSTRTTGYENLFDILQSGGETDPARLNLQFEGIDRGTEANTQAVTGRLAGAGLEGSAAGQALLAAIGQSGVGQKSVAQANENQLVEQRKRDDLGLFLQLIVNPGLTRRGQDKQLQAALASRQKNGFDFGAITGLLGKLLGGLNTGDKTGSRDSTSFHYQTGSGNDLGGVPIDDSGTYAL